MKLIEHPGNRQEELGQLLPAPPVADFMAPMFGPCLGATRSTPREFIDLIATIDLIAANQPTPSPLPLGEGGAKRIVAKVEQRMTLVEVLETQLAAARATAANLLSALVAELTAGGNAGAAPRS